MTLFKKCIVFTDIHVGLRHNHITHLNDCVEYIDWLIESAKLQDAETCICMGDFFHHRNTINSQSLEYAIKILEKLNNYFKKTYIITGNHDLYFRDSRAITSMRFASLFPKIELVDTIMTRGDVSFVPWLVEDEWKGVENLASKYLFGHLELPGFKMNAMVEMPDNGTLNSKHFPNQTYVFSGHFHKRQSKGKIHYIGNTFGHNFSDVWDFERGAMFLEWDKEPVFLDYTEGPRFININLSALLENPELHLKPKTYLQAVLDLDISYEEAAFLRETFVEQYKVREFKIIQNNEDELTKEYDGDITFQTINEIVTEQILSITSGSFDPKKLVEIYNGL